MGDPWKEVLRGESGDELSIIAVLPGRKLFLLLLPDIAPACRSMISRLFRRLTPLRRSFTFRSKASPSSSARRFHAR